MLQRQLRVGDIVEDYCPRERRLSDHAIVAMVGETIRQTRCTTCDAEHEYKQAKIPVSRRKKVEMPLPPKAAAAAPAPANGGARLEPPPADPLEQDDRPEGVEGAAAIQRPVAAAAPDAHQPEADERPPHRPLDGPVHRRLIRATLPRVEGQEVPRPIPEFTMHRVPAGRGNFLAKGFKQGSGGHHRHGGRAAQGNAAHFGQRGHGGAQGHGRGGNRPQGGHGGRHPQHGSSSGSRRRKKH